jgi:hypothetical protein
VAFAVCGDALGWNGIVLLTATMIATSLWILYHQMLSEGSDILLATGLTLLASAACFIHWFARPHVFSFVLVAFFGEQLSAFERGNVRAGQLFLRLVPLTVLWVNLHAGFLTGLILIGVYWIGAATGLLAAGSGTRTAAWSRMKSLTLTGAGCSVASLANPNGWRLHEYLGNFLQHSTLVGFVSEFRSPNFHSPNAHGFLLLLGLLAATLIVIRARFSPTEILLVGWAGCFALRWVRNVPLFAIVVIPILARHLSAWLGQAPESWLLRYRKTCRDMSELDRRAGGRGLTALAFAILVLVIAKPRIAGGEPVIATGPLTNRFPVAAANFLRQHPGAVSGEMFNDYGWGGYLMLVIPDRKVFVDGRNDFYGADLIQDFVDVNKVHPDWDAVLRRYGVGWTILPRDHPLNILLALHTDWSAAYTDEVTAIYTRKHE